MPHRQRHISQTPEPWRPGSWEPGRFGLSDSISITALMVGIAAVRGIDYLTPGDGPSPALSIVEQAFPLQVWGLAFALPALVLAMSAILRIHGGVWFGHWLLGITYTGLAVGLGAEYTDRAYWDGIRSATSMMLPAVLHIGVAIRTGWRPPLWTPKPSPV